MATHKSYFGTRTTPHREIELVAICHDRRGMQLALSVTLSHHARGLIRETFEHDDTPGGLADALVQVAEYVRAGAPVIFPFLTRTVA